MRQKKNRVQDFSLDSDSEPENDKEQEFTAKAGDIIGKLVLIASLPI